jgi:sugar phosphate isomerase/epimerase
MRKIELLASYWTVAGDVYATGPTEVSPFGFRDRVEAASKAGFRGMGLNSDDLQAVSAKLGYPAMKRILEDNGIRHVEIELIGGWFASGARKQASDRAWTVMLEAAEKLGAYYIKAFGDPEGGEWPDDHLAAGFRKLCADAANAGTRVALEMMPFTDVHTLNRSIRIVEGAGADNGGLCIDIWHTTRCGVSNAEIAHIPTKLFMAAEINDALATPIGSLLEDSTQHRKLPGEGELDVRGFIAACEAACFDGYYGVEILSKVHRVLPLVEAARRAYDAAIAQFAPTDGASAL